jgi:hypothetical protein
VRSRTRTGSNGLKLREVNELQHRTRRASSREFNNSNDRSNLLNT